MSNLPGVTHQGQAEARSETRPPGSRHPCLYLSPRTLEHHRMQTLELGCNTFISQKGKPRPREAPGLAQGHTEGWQQARPSSGHLLDTQTPGHTAPGSTAPSECHISLSTLGASGQGCGRESNPQWQRVRGLGQRGVCHCGWRLKAAPLFRSAGCSRQAGEGGPAVAGMVSWLGCRGPQGPGSCHR